MDRLAEIESEVYALKNQIGHLLTEKQKLLEKKAGLKPLDIIEYGRTNRKTGQQIRTRGLVREVVFWSDRGNPGLIRVNPQKPDGSYSARLQQVFHSDEWEKVTDDH